MNQNFTDGRTYRKQSFAKPDGAINRGFETNRKGRRKFYIFVNVAAWLLFLNTFEIVAL